jgi:hypothetical protein
MEDKKMMNAVLLISTIINFYIFIGCAQQATFNAGQSKPRSQDQKPEEVKPVETSEVVEEKKKEVEAKVPAVYDLTKCWVGLSGALVFGGLKVGGPTITQFHMNDAPTADPELESVIRVRDNPYEYLRDGKEIDAPINTSLDGMMITPGVKVEVFNLEKTLIFTFFGPAIVRSEFMKGRQAVQELYATGWVRHGDTLPRWVGKIIDEKRDQEVTRGAPLLGLIRAHSIKVSKIPDTACE